MTAALLALALGAPPSTSTLSLPNFEIVYTGRAAAAARLLVPALEEERTGLAARLGRDYPGRTRVLVAAGPDELAAIAGGQIRPPRWASGAAAAEENIVAFDAGALLGDDGRSLVRHELAHLALGRAGGTWPRWFQEGFAMAHAGEWSVGLYAAMYRAAVRGDAIPLASLAGDWPDRAAEREVAYAQSAAFVGHLFERRGAAAMRDLVDRVRLGDPFAAAFAAAYGRPLEVEEGDWLAAARRRYRLVPLLTGTGTIWFAITLLFLYAYRRVRARRRERMLALAVEEKAREAAGRIARAETAQGADVPAEPETPVRGRWLH